MSIFKRYCPFCSLNSVTSQYGMPAIDKVQKFYQRDDISRISPGKRDVVTVRSDQGKVWLQKRHLYMNLKETHSLFQEDHPEIKIGLTKFGMLRPQQVKFSSETPANVCTCIYHQNVILALDSLHKYDPTIPIYSKDFAATCLVSAENEACWYGSCDHDSCNVSSFYPEPKNCEEPAKWVKWEEVNGRYIKNEKSGIVEDLYIYLCNILPEFFIHSFVKRKQAKSYEEDKIEALMENSDTLMLQIDFAENFTR